MDESIWKAIAKCDAEFDGKFYYGVITTGIFCRPSCKSRTPSKANVRVFQEAEEALQAGFRPCKRCRPDELHWHPDEQLAMTVKKFIDRNYTEKITLQSLASRTFVSPFHLQRVFSKVMNVSPVQYVTEVRLQAAKYLLAHTTLPIRQIAQQTGFRTGPRLSAVFGKKLGVPPAEFRENIGFKVQFD
ncbi:bifunctional transcriptional activator/DNA repair enzyme AdaA [Paenibacillus alkalitolerans]|uniref:bifunctional transcriptional activator/DNA repair enzyme AdaA n=1 Tax=Paenibacillus alkalitolerans TaxID=2799335 RepID=UPI0018F6A222|nr:Ada metal-binding domain-containing protein [Paenibacillus alkalitolerans]